MQAMQSLYRALSEPEALVKLVGEPETGKSTLCEKLTAYMRHKGFRVVYFRYAIESPDMLRAMLARELDLPNATNFARMLEDISLSANDKPLVLLFDDAHLLSQITLLEIYRLVEVQSGAARKLHIVLCGEPALERKIAQHSQLQSLQLHITHNIVLRPMHSAELALFLKAFFDKAKTPDLTLEPAALNYFYKCTKGMPGPTLTLCGLMVAAHREHPELRVFSKSAVGDIVQQARMAGSAAALTTPVRESNQWVVLGPVAVVVVIASIGMLYQQLAPPSENAVVAFSRAQGEEGVEPSPFVAVTTPTTATSVVLPETNIPGINEPEIVVPETVNPDTEAQDIAIAEPVAVAASGPASASVQEQDFPVSDSDLVLVTAAERGVAEADIVQPLFENIEIIADDNNALLAPVDSEVDSSITETLSETTRVATAIAQAPVTVTSPPAVAADTTAAQYADSGASPTPANEVQDQPVPNSVSTTPAAAPATSNQQTPAIATDVPVVATAESTITESAIAVTVAPDTENVATSQQVSANATAAARTLNTAAIRPSAAIAEDSHVDDSPVVAVQNAVRGWVRAWQQQNQADYFASYHEDFVPRYHASVPQWRQDRQRVIGNARAIELQLHDIEMVAGPEVDSSANVEVHFWLDYASPTYADSTLKKLVLKRQEADWLIVEEVNLEVRRSP